MARVTGSSICYRPTPTSSRAPEFRLTPSRWRITARWTTPTTASRIAQRARARAGWWRRSNLELEQIVERFLRGRLTATRGCGARLALDLHAWREQRAAVGDILRADARGNRLPALEPRPGIKRRTVNAGVQVHAAIAALAQRG